MAARLKSVHDFLLKCQGSDKFEEICKAQFDAAVQELRGIKALSHEQASEILTLIDQMLWKDDMKKVLKEIIQDKVAFVQSPTRVILQHWTHFPLYLREEDWLRLTNPSMQSQAFTVTLKEMMDHLCLFSN